MTFPMGSDSRTPGKPADYFEIYGNAVQDEDDL